MRSNSTKSPGITRGAMERPATRTKTLHFPDALEGAEAQTRLRCGVAIATSSKGCVVRAGPGASTPRRPDLFSERSTTKPARTVDAQTLHRAITAVNPPSFPPNSPRSRVGHTPYMDENSALTARYETIDAAEVRAMIARKEPEGLTLDYKRFDPSGEPNKHDKDHVAEVVSGFANSAGGILVWGVATESRPGDSALPTSVVPIRDPRRAQARIRELASQLVQPPVSGVRVDAIDMGDGGVVKMLVPQSDDGPHRTAAKDGQYYRRAADRFDAMFHHEIAAAFSRPTRAKLIVRGYWYPNLVVEKPHGYVGGRVTFTLQNVGRAACFVPYVRVIGDRPPRAIRVANSVGTARTPNFQIIPRPPVNVGSLLDSREWIGTLNDVLHVGSSIDLIDVIMPLSDGKQAHPSYDLVFWVAGHNVPLTPFKYTVDTALILSEAWAPPNEPE